MLLCTRVCALTAVVARLDIRGFGCPCSRTDRIIEGLQSREERRAYCFQIASRLEVAIRGRFETPTGARTSFARAFARQLTSIPCSLLRTYLVIFFPLLFFRLCIGILIRLHAQTSYPFATRNFNLLRGLSPVSRCMVYFAKFFLFLFLFFFVQTSFLQ